MSDGNESTFSKVSIFDIVLSVISLVLYLVDITFDIVLLINYHASGDTRWFAFTLTTLLVSSVIVSAFTFRMELRGQNGWIVIICLILQIMPVLGYVAFSLVLTLK